MDHFSFLSLVLVMLSRLFIAALWSPEGIRLTSLPLLVMFIVYCDYVTFPFGILGQAWYLIVSIPDPCCLSYFKLNSYDTFNFKGLGHIHWLGTIFYTLYILSYYLIRENIAKEK